MHESAPQPLNSKHWNFFRMMQNDYTLNTATLPGFTSTLIISIWGLFYKRNYIFRECEATAGQ